MDDIEKNLLDTRERERGRDATRTAGTQRNQGILERLLSGSFSSASGREGAREGDGDIREKLLYKSRIDHDRDGRDDLDDLDDLDDDSGDDQDVHPDEAQRRQAPGCSNDNNTNNNDNDNDNNDDPGLPPKHPARGTRATMSANAQNPYQEPGVAYLTLVSQHAPLHDGNPRMIPNNNRVKDRRISFYKTLAIMVAYAVVIATVVFALTPRKVEVGTVAVVPDGMRWSQEEEAYTLRLNVTLPAYNPNFLPYDVRGELLVNYYDAQAGNVTIPVQRLGVREHTAVEVVVDASRLDKRYVLSVLSQCSLFPHVLTFFISGNVETRRFGGFGWSACSEIDSWFFVDCGVS